MSGYSSRAAVVEVIRSSIAADSARTGLPRDPADYNIAGVVRDCFHPRGDGGWSSSLDADAFADSLRRNLRRRTPTPAQGAPAMPRAAVLSHAAESALRAATTTETTMTLPPITLDRNVYKEVADALARIGGGGVWNRKAKAFVFPSDPRPDVAAMLQAGAVPDVRTAAEQDKELSFFRTPGRRRCPHRARARRRPPRRTPLGAVRRGWRDPRRRRRGPA